MTPEEQKKAAEEALKLLTEQANIQKQVSESYDDFIKGVKKYKAYQESINRNLKLEKKIEEEIAAAKAKGTAAGDEDAKIAEIKLELLQKQTAEMQKQGIALKQALVEANKLNLTFSKVSGEAVKGFSKLPGFIQQSFGKLKGLGLFEMEKAIKMSALQMGVLSKEANGFRGNIVNASKQTVMIGIGIKELAEMQSTYSDEIGRSVILSEKALVAMGQMAASTVLGAEGSARMAAEMEIQGISAERTGKFVEQTLNDSHKMGLNASKVVKNVSNNIKMLNKYNFKEGVKGLAKMAMTVSKMGVDMNFATGMADKLWDVEGAVDMSAQLQVMGGEWAKLADPFHLMYMARNDIEGLTKELGNAAAASAVFNDKTGEFDIATKEMHKLKIIAEQTGISYDELITSAKNMKKFSMLETQLRFGMSDEDKEFLTSRAVLNEKGEGEIMINGNPKLLKQLSEQDIKILKSQAAEQQNMKKRAEQSRTFDETISDIFNKLKISLLPFVKALNDELVPKLQKLAERFDSEGWGEKIEKFAEVVGSFVTTIGGFIIDNPLISGAIYLSTKLGGLLWDAGKWFVNGMALAKGFNMTANVGGGSGTPMDIDGNGNSGGKGKNRRPSGKGFKSRLKPKMPKGVGGWGGAALGALSLGMDAYGQYGEQKEAGMSTGENTAKTATSTAGRAGGMWAGAALGAELGLLGGPLAWITSPLGALIGGAAGYFGGDWLAGKANDSWGKKPMTEVHDGIIGSPIHDGFLNGMSGTILGGMLGGGPGAILGGMLGSDFSKGRGVIQGGKITPIDNKDDLLAMKPGGVIDKTIGNSTSNVIKYDFGEIKINGEIKVTSPGNPGIAVDLLKDPQFKRDIARTITAELEKNKNGGKNRG
jgi:hypothetical protein